ncbi:unnamed protein product, partial [Phaedon cochleariae]
TSRGSSPSASPSQSTHSGLRSPSRTSHIVNDRCLLDNIPDPNSACPTDINILDEETLRCLGGDPSENDKKETQCHAELAPRWTKILKNGLDQDMKTSLIAKYPIPSNCTRLSAPMINPEIKKLLSQSQLTKDKVQTLGQNQLGTGIVALGEAINILLVTKNRDKELLTHLCDAGQLLTDLHHSMSISRRKQIIPLLSRSASEIAQGNDIDEFLFGKDFAEQCKNEKAVEKSSTELMRNMPSVSKPVSKKPRVPFIQQGKLSLNRKAPPRYLREHQRYKGHFPQNKENQRKDYRPRRH